jgi:hypothetical protein
MFGKPGEKSAKAADQKSGGENTNAAARTVSAPPAASSAPTGASDKSAAANPAAQAPTFRYVDRAELPETFADSISGLFFDGQSLRIEFAVSRVDEIKPNTPITGRRYPACRVVLPPAAAVELINKMQQIGAALIKAGMLKAAEPPSP